MSGAARLLAATEERLPRDARAVFLRADGAKSIGLGHLTRSRLFGAHLYRRYGLHPLLLTREDPATRAFLERTGLEAVLLPAGTGGEEERDLLRGLAARHEDAILVFDVQEPRGLEPLLDALARTQLLTVVVWDGPERLALSADVVINGSPDQLAHDYSAEAAVHLVGPQHFLMNPPRVSLPAPAGGRPHRLAVTLGGTDHHDLLFRALDALCDVAPELPLAVAASSSSGQLERLQRRLCRLPACELLVDLDGLDELWAAADLALTAGGNTLFERIAAGLPGATLCQIPLQSIHAQAFCRAGVNLDLGYGPELSDGALCERLAAFLEDRELHVSQSRLARQVVDGRGLERVGRIVHERRQEKNRWITSD